MFPQHAVTDARRMLGEVVEKRHRRHGRSDGDLRRVTGIGPRAGRVARFGMRVVRIRVGRGRGDVLCGIVISLTGLLGIVKDDRRGHGGNSQNRRPDHEQQRPGRFLAAAYIGSPGIVVVGRGVEPQGVRLAGHRRRLLFDEVQSAGRLGSGRGRSRRRGWSRLGRVPGPQRRVVCRPLVGLEQAELGGRNLVQQLLRQLGVLARGQRTQMGHPGVGGRLDHVRIALERIEPSSR